jgi:hypothetical protein
MENYRRGIETRDGDMTHLDECLHTQCLAILPIWRHESTLQCFHIGIGKGRKSFKHTSYLQYASGLISPCKSRQTKECILTIGW